MVFASAMASLWFLGLICFLRTSSPLLIASAILFISMTWRAMSAAYIDGAGPVFAEEIARPIGGDGGGLFLLGLALTVLPMAWLWRNKALVSIFSTVADNLFIQRDTRTLGDVAFWVGCCGVAGLYSEMLIGGVVPLVDCMERMEYSMKYAGVLHNLLFEHGAMIALNLGILTVYPRLRGGNYDLRHGGLLIALLFYALLAGHRFSAFYVFIAFFCMPWSLVVAARQYGLLPPVMVSQSRLQRLMKSPAFFLVLAALTAVLLLGALGNSYVRVRGVCQPFAIREIDLLDEILQKLRQRIAIQPAQMWYPTWERIFLGGSWEPGDAWQRMFVSPIDPARNSGVQYLMAKELGEERTRELLGRGNQYASGHVEVVFELFGPLLGWPVFLVVGAVLAWLLRVWASAVWSGYFLTALTVGYVYYGFLLLVVGGMPNFIIVWTFWVKIAAFSLFYFLEHSRVREGRPVLPYVLRSTKIN